MASDHIPCPPNDPPDSDGKAAVFTRLPVALLERVDAYAKSEQRSRANAVARLLELALDARDGKERAA